MAFELTEYSEVRLATVTSRVEKHGDDDKPAVTLSLELKTENYLLDALDLKLRERLFLPKGGDEQQVIEGVPESRPVLACNSIERVTLQNKHEGWTLEIDHSGNEDDCFKLGGCKLSKFSVEPIQGGSIVLRFTVGTSDLDAERMGWIGMHNGELIYVRLLAPKAKEAAIDGSVEAFNADHPEVDEDTNAGDLFAQSQGVEGAEVLDEGSNDAGDSDAEEDEGEGRYNIQPAVSKPVPRIAAKYRNSATGETWSGRGLQPKWLKAAIAFGAKLDDFAATASVIE